MSNNTGSKMFFSFLTGDAIGAGLALLFAPQSGKETRSQIKSFLTGAAVGAGLALLFAPQSGKETRRQIKDFSEKLDSEVKDNVDKIGEKAKDLIEGAKEEIQISQTAKNRLEAKKLLGKLKKNI